jgi:hypothetical protein
LRPIVTESLAKEKHAVFPRQKNDNALSSKKMTQYKGATQDTLKRIYLILMKVSKKRSAAGVDATQSARIGNKINLYSKSLGLGQFTKK